MADRIHYSGGLFTERSLTAWRQKQRGTAAFQPRVGA